MPITIAHFLVPVTKGGGEVLIAELALRQSQLYSHGKIYLFSASRNDYLREYLHSTNVTYKELSILSSKFAYSKFETLLRSIPQFIWFLYLSVAIKVDIIHTHSFPCQFLFPLQLIKLLSINIPRQIHTKHISGKKSIVNSLLWKLIETFITVTYVSKYARLNAMGSKASKNSFIIKNPTSTSFFEIGDSRVSTSSRQILRSLKSACIISRIAKGKGHLELIHSLNEIWKTRPDLKFKLYIAGDGDYMPRLVETINNYGLSSDVHLLGLINQDDVKQLLTECDFAIHPSFNEGLSISCVQYLAALVPTISFDYGPSREVFGQKNLYYSDTPTLEKCLELIENKSFYSEIISSYFESRKSYNWQSILDQYNRAYYQ